MSGKGKARKSGGKASGDAVRVGNFIFLNMLTLNPITLFYYNLSEASQAANSNVLDDDISSWAKRVAAKSSRSKSGARSTSTPSLDDNSRTSTRPALTIRSSLSGNVRITVNSDGGLSDHDETRGAEYEAALNAPVKPRGLRLTSSALVSLKKEHQGRPRNGGLPAECFEKNAWCKSVISTLFQWAACQRDPWNLGDRNIRDALKAICNAVYGDLDLELEDSTEDDDGLTYIQSDAFRLAGQRLSEWRSTFGSIAIIILVAFFQDKHHEQHYRTDAERQKFAVNQLQNYRFVYKYTRDEDPKKWYGLFRGPFVLLTFAYHFTATSGAVHAAGLYPDDAVLIPRGSLALAASAVEHALELIRDASITIATIAEANMNPQTGQVSNRSFAFSEVYQGTGTRAWSRNAQRTFEETPSKLVKLIDEAKVFEKASRRAADEGSDEEEDERTLLVDVSSGEASDN